MANLKISQLAAASTPLAGTEVLPVVQGGVTEKVSVADLTAGRAISATSLTVDAGAVGTPSLTTSGDTDTGVYFPAANTVGLAVAGAQVLKAEAAAVTSAQPVVLPAGTTSAPALTTSGDLNTGVWFPAADTVSASTGGVEALRINSSQEVIVGNGDAVASPASRTLRGTDGSGTNIAGGNITVQAGRGTGTGTGGYIRFMTSPAGTSGTTLQTATERVRIDNAGGVGLSGLAGSKQRLRIGGTLPSSSNDTHVFMIDGVIPSTTTNDAIGILNYLSTQAASFTLNRMYFYYAAASGIGAGSTVTNMYGYAAETVGATNSYGFYGGIASGAGRYNFYAAGTADNYFEGKTTLGGGGGYNVIVGNAALATSATVGFLWIPSCAGAPTGAPTAPYTNAAALVADTTNNRLYVRTGSTWRYATLT